MAAGNTQILIDAGIEPNRIVRELKDIGADTTNIHGLIISHEHGDHCREASSVALSLKCPLYVSDRTLPHLRWALSNHEVVRTFRVGESFAIGDISIHPFRVFHDAVDPCGFLIEGLSCKAGSVKLAIATDLGTVTPQLKRSLYGCDVLVIEANHDREMLLNGSYPWDLKQRIRSPVGHLSNEAAAELIAELAKQGVLKKVILAHLSQHNNLEELALATVRRRLDSLFSCEVYLSYHERRSVILEL